MAANRIQLQKALEKKYDKFLFAKDVLNPVFGTAFSLKANAVEAPIKPNNTESKSIDKVEIYGEITLEDGTEIICYEILLKPKVRIEQSKVAIQQYIRKLLTAGQAALVNFISNSGGTWRFTLVAKDSELTESGVREKTTHAKRYTYLLGEAESCKTAAERLEILSTETYLNFEKLVKAFSVEKLSKAFFDEYKIHYLRFVEALINSNYKISVFNNDEKFIRDFAKKLLGRIVFLYFVQKKNWLGATDTNYEDGNTDFIMNLFLSSGGDDTFYPNWLTTLFFETLNKPRPNDEFQMPDGSVVTIPFLNGGLFDKEDHDEHLITLKSTLFHNHNNPDDPKHRGFLDFLNAFNFTVHEDSPDDQTVAVDPEMLGHIFENLLEDNKDKGAFYTPKEIVHYMCQESLIEYLTTHLSKEYTVYRTIAEDQIELFGNESRKGQLKLIEELGDKALNREDVAFIVKYKDITKLTSQQLNRISELLDSVKILDPAIGSGAFPMGLLQEIFAIKELIAYQTNTDWKPDEVKENIIQNSIYGVDIEKGAVDIARLRFWLSLIVDKNKPKALPNLDYKIVVGDSLVSKFEGEIIEIDWDKKDSAGKSKEYIQNIQRLLKEIAEKQKEYFKPENTNKKKLSAKIRQIKLELLINQLSFNKDKYMNTTQQLGGMFPTAKEIKHNTEFQLTVAGYDKQIQKLEDLKNHPERTFNHFDYKLDFPEVLNPHLVDDNAGFDIVIGNPPYIEFKKIPNETKQNFAKYKTANRKYDIFCLFIELSSWIIKKEGIHCYINPTTFLVKDYGGPLRRLINDKFQIIEIFDFADYQIFETAVTYTGIFLFKKVKLERYSFYYQRLKNIENKVNIESLFLKKEDTQYKEATTISSRKLEEDTWFFGSDVSSKILESIEGNHPRLINLTKYIFVGIQSGKDEVFFVNTEVIDKFKLEKELVLPILKGKDVRKYSIDWSGTFVIYPYDKKTNKVINENELRKKFPNIYMYLLENRQNLKGRQYFDNSNKEWYELWCERVYSKFTETKIVNAEIAPENRFQIDSSGILGNTKIFNTVLKDEWKDYYYVLLSILNSKVMNYYHKKTASPKAGGFFDYKTQFIQNYPIEFPKNILPFNRLISYLLFLKTQPLKEVLDLLMPTYFEQIIDGMVYELYFPELLRNHSREIIKHLGELPEITDSMNDEEKMAIIKTVFNRLNEKEHPVRVNLFYMDSIPKIRIIEGKNENN